MKRIFLIGSLVMVLFLGACGGGDDEPSDPCTVPITIELEITRSDANTPSGGVTITATGGNGGFTYSLDGGAGQASNTFSDLAVGSYTLVVEDREGCTQQRNFDIEEALSASFATDINPIIQANCAISGCHVTGGSAPFTFASYSQIASRADRIKIRTQARTMPPSGSGSLTQLQIDLIAAWVDAGAQDN